MLRGTSILGDRGDPHFSGRAVERVSVGSQDAGKRRLRAETDLGTDLAIDLPRGSYLRHGAVVFDDGERIIVVERTPEEALVLRFVDELDRRRLAAEAVALGHAFGNQHVPIEIVGGDVRLPVTTSRDVALETVRSLGLEGVEASFEFVRLGCDRPLAKGHAH